MTKVFDLDIEIRILEDGGCYNAPQIWLKINNKEKTFSLTEGRSADIPGGFKDLYEYILEYIEQEELKKEIHEKSKILEKLKNKLRAK